MFQYRNHLVLRCLVIRFAGAPAVTEDNAAWPSCMTALPSINLYSDDFWSFAAPTQEMSTSKYVQGLKGIVGRRQARTAAPAGRLLHNCGICCGPLVQVLRLWHVFFGLVQPLGGDT